MWSSLQTLFLRGLAPVSETLLQDVAHQDFAATIPWWEMGMNVTGNGTYTYGGSAITWRYCDNLGDIPVECGNLTVPWDHFRTEGEEKRAVKLLRLRSKNLMTTKHLFLGMMGPALSSVNHLRKKGKELHQLLGNDFHLVAFDHRGVGESTWRAQCYPQPDRNPTEFTPQSPLITDPYHDNAGAYRWAGEFVQGCPMANTYYEKYLSTPQLAADLHYVRGKLAGEGSLLYYWGYSYGALLGQTYAKMYPDSVGGLVLDAPTNLVEWYDDAGLTEKWTDTDAVFDGFFEECLRARGNCSLSQFVTIEEEEHLRFVGARDLRDLVVDFATKHFSEKTRRATFMKLLHEPSYWRSFADSMTALMRNGTKGAAAAANGTKGAAAGGGGGGGGLLDFLPLMNDDTSDAMSTDDPRGREKTLRNFIFLNDALTGKPHWPSRKYTALSRLAKLRSLSEFALYDAPMLYKKQRWEEQRGLPFNIREPPVIQTKRPILFLASEFDPVSPMISAVKATDMFEGSRVLQVDGYGHGALGLPSRCVMDYVRRYLRDRELPGNATRCQHDVPYFEGKQERAIFHGIYPSVEDV